MSFITFQCYACNHLLKVGADKAGKKAKCNKCGTILTIPVASTVTAPPPSAPAQSVRRPAPPPLPPAGSLATPVGPTPVGPTPVAAIAEDDDFPPAAAVADDDLGYEDDRPRRKGDTGFSLWGRVRLSLLLVFIAMCVLAGGFALELIGYLLFSIDLIRFLTATNPFAGGGGSGRTAGWMWVIGNLLHAAAAIAAIVGYVFAMLGPNKRGSMGLAIATLAVAGVELLLTFIFKMPWLFGLVSERGGGGIILGSEFGTWFMLLLVQLLFAAELILFPVYLRSISYALKSSAHARTCMYFMALGCVYAGERLLTFILWYVTLKSVGREGPSKGLIWIDLILLWIGAFVFLAMIIWYPILLWRTRKMVH